MIPLPLQLLPHLRQTAEGISELQAYTLLSIKEVRLKMMEIVTADLSRFGHREREMAEELLRAWRVQGLPDGFENEEVTINLNTHSGYVFLSNEDYQVAMMNGDSLESYFYDFETGEEGFLEELSEEAINRINNGE